MGTHKLYLVYRLEQNIKRSLMLNFEAPTSLPSFSNGHPSTLGCCQCLLCLSICPHLKNNCQKLKNQNFDNLDMGNYGGYHVYS